MSHTYKSYRSIRNALGDCGGALRSMHPAKLVLFGYAAYTLVGWLLLSLPWAQRHGGNPALDNLFISTSAMSTTGLATLSVSDDYTVFGQVVILLLIQLGGIGYMTFGSFVVLSRQGALSPVRSGIAQTVFSLPESFRIDKFIRSVIVFTAVIELLGAAALYPVLLRGGDPHPAWSAVFHSVSSFCTAGFSLNNDSFARYASDFWLNLIVGVLSYLGAIGFIVCVDLWRRSRGKTKAITLTSRIILWSTFWLSVCGTVLLFLGEPSLQDKPADARLLAAFFQSMTAMTTVGFNTVDIAQLSKASLLLIIVLMVIGASPSGTGGGIKSTTFTALLGVMRSALRGTRQVQFWGRVVPLERIWVAVASLGFYMTLLVAGTYLLEQTEPSAFDRNLFEAASALGTVGLSTGITAGLSNLGKCVIIFLMFCGRLGPLTFGIALFCHKPVSDATPDNDLAV